MKLPRQQNTNFVLIMSENKLIQTITEDIFLEKEIDVDILRLDKLHPIVSGNKLFKLKYYLEEVKQKNNTGIVTLGGSHSNHLVAAAYAAKERGICSIGIVRGERPALLSKSLLDCISYGMQLEFIPRNDFDELEINELEKKYPDKTIIPQGGYGSKGARGAKEILSIEDTTGYNYIVASSGTGTMAAGLINEASAYQKIILVSALKNNFSVEEEITALIDKSSLGKKNFQVLFDFHQGGYAKKNNKLLDSMNQFFTKHSIPTDFVYTGKLVSAFYELVKANFFEKKSRILLIHSGGLQGNRSLNKGDLIF